MSLSEEKYNDLYWVLSTLKIMIDETMYHMQTFAHTLDVHHNKEAAQIFSFSYEQFKKENEIVWSCIGAKELPTIAPWETPYPHYQHPSEVLSEIDYLSTQEDVWKTIHKVNQIHIDFYDFLLGESENSDLLRLIQKLLAHGKNSQIDFEKKILNLPDQNTERHEDLDLISSENFKGIFQ